MKVRTLTLGLPGRPALAVLARAMGELARARALAEREGLEVQTVRLALGDWPDERGSARERADFFAELDLLALREDVLVSTGRVRTAEQVREAAAAIAASQRLYAIVDGGDPERGVQEELVASAAAAILSIAVRTPDGLGNFRFGVGFALTPDTPFFPAGFHGAGAPSLSVGLENSGLAAELLGARELPAEARWARFAETYAAECRRIAALGGRAADAAGAAFAGLDPSIVPSILESESLVHAFRGLGVEFGGPGTLSICARLTAVAKGVGVRTAGFAGLMLPLLEDFGLAAAARAGRLSLDNLLAYSSVCSVGLDTVPLPGDVGEPALRWILRDVGALACRLRKPLAARVLPLPGRKAGDETRLVHPYLLDSTVLAVPALHSD